MKIQKNLPLMLVLQLMAVASVACSKGGRASKKDRHGSQPPASQAENEIKKPGDDQNKDGGSQKDKFPTPELEISSLSSQLLQTSLPGDFRVFKSFSDSSGNLLTVLVTDLKKADATSPAEEGFAVLKFDASGKEIWRFPTLESQANANDITANYMKGSLTNVSLNAENELWMVGGSIATIPYENLAALKDFQGNANARYNDQFKGLHALRPSTTNFAVSFVHRVFASGLSSDSLRVVSRYLPHPIGYMPISLMANADHTLVMESISEMTPGASGSPSYVHQIQKLDADLTQVESQVCFMSPTAHPSLEKTSLVPRLKLAALAQIEKTSTSPTACWDVINATKIAPSPEFMPKAVSSDSDSEVTLEKLDLMLSKGTIAQNELYVSYSLANQIVFPLAFQGLESKMSTSIFSTIGAFPALVNQSSNKDWLPLDQYALNDGTLSLKSRLKAPIQNVHIRSPKSMQFASSSDGLNALLLWTDLHQKGEKNEGNRYLKILKLSNIGRTVTPNSTYQEIAPPVSDASDFLTTFSSVSLVRQTQEFKAFATVAQRSNKESESIHGDSLLYLIGGASEKTK